jgi:hypothetical protein
VINITPLPLYPRGNSTRYPLNRDWVGSRVGLEDVEKRKFLTLPGPNSNPSVIQAEASRYTDCAFPVPMRCFLFYFKGRRVWFSHSPVVTLFGFWLLQFIACKVTLDVKINKYASSWRCLVMHSRLHVQPIHHITMTCHRSPFSVVKVKLSLCLSTTPWGSVCTDPGFLDLCTSWRRVAKLTPRQIYPRYPLDRRLGGPQDRSE